MNNVTTVGLNLLHNMESVFLNPKKFEPGRIERSHNCNNQMPLVNNILPSTSYFGHDGILKLFWSINRT